MKNTAIIVEAETIQVPNKIEAPMMESYTAIVVRIDVQGVEKTQQIVLQCSARHYCRLKDALGGSEDAIRKVLEGVAANIMNEGESLSNNPKKERSTIDICKTIICGAGAGGVLGALASWKIGGMGLAVLGTAKALTIAPMIAIGVGLGVAACTAVEVGRRLQK